MKKQPPKPVVITADEATSQALKPVRDFAAGHGNVQKIAETVTALGGKNVSRQMVGMWVSGKSKPFLGTGILLILAVQHLQAKEPATITIQLELQ